MGKRVTINDLAVGGEGVGRLEDGRAVFVVGSAVGDELLIDLTEEKKRYARGRIVEVLSPGENRRDPPCPNVVKGCGGCDWQHLNQDAQIDAKLSIVAQSLERLGSISPPDIGYVSGPEEKNYRTTMRVGVVDGHAALRAARSNESNPTRRMCCSAPYDRRYSGQRLFTRPRCDHPSDRTGDRLVMGEPVADGFSLPDDVRVVGRNEARKGAEAFVFEEAAGIEWRISAQSFFQSSPEGAESLIGLTAEWLSVQDVGEQVMVDLYAGVGLFSGTVGDWFEKVTAVESSKSATRDAQHNLGSHVSIHQLEVEKWTPELADVVIADPPRSGLRASGVEVIRLTEAPHVVLISCDAGALGRDARLLTAAGYELDQIDVLDMFPQTSHVEVVLMDTSSLKLKMVWRPHSGRQSIMN